MFDPSVAKKVVAASRRLCTSAERLSFGGAVAHVYNPLVYARAPHEAYLRRFAGRPGIVLLVGMNPGPFGMAQTGVPFGEVAFVRDWMRIVEPVGRPPREHPKRPIEGFACRRSEVSGRRLYGWAQDRFGTAESFFERFFVWNLCPLVFVGASGQNVTPDKLPAPEREPLLAVCDQALGAIARILEPRVVVGVGAWAEKRSAMVLGARGVPIGAMLHPSPASPKANRGWAAQAEADLIALGAL